MTEAEQPPVKAIAKWRWIVHTLLLTAFPLSLGILSFFLKEPLPTVTAAQPLLPPTLGGLLLVCAEQLTIFAVLCATAWLFSRANTDQLLLKWRGGFITIPLGFGYSIALRIGIAILALTVIISVSGGNEKEMESIVKDYRPQTEVLFSEQALQDPVYLITCLTVVSFLLAGFREELWRAGMLAGFAALFPRFYQHVGGKITAVFLVAIIFGLGHLPQGMGGVVLTGTLGIGLGLIMVFHRSIWEAVFAHGFFNATTFLALYVIAKVPSLFDLFEKMK